MLHQSQKLKVEAPPSITSRFITLSCPGEETLALPPSSLPLSPSMCACVCMCLLPLPTFPLFLFLSEILVFSILPSVSLQTVDRSSNLQFHVLYVTDFILQLHWPSSFLLFLPVITSSMLSTPCLLLCFYSLSSVISNTFFTL